MNKDELLLDLMRLSNSHGKTALEIRDVSTGLAEWNRGVSDGLFIAVQLLSGNKVTDFYDNE